jgi:hypothetical protein
MPKGDFSGSVGYFSHQSLLTKWALQAPEGSTIVELGCGKGSTLILSQIAAHRKLRYIVYTDDAKWADVVKPSCLPNIEWNIIDDWTKWTPTEEAYLYFLDNSELMINRYKQIEKMIGKAKYVMCHDSNIYKKRGCPLDGRYNVIDEDTTQTPQTAVIDLTGVPQPPKKNNVLEKNITFSNKTNETPKISTSMKVKSISNNLVVNKEHVIEPETPTMEFNNIKKPLVDVGYVETPLLIPKRKEFNPKVELEDGEDPKVAVVCCFCPGGDYDSHFLDYVQRLSDGVHNNTTDDTDFFCITLMNLDKVTGVKHIEPLSGKWKGWHVKAEVFRADLWEGYDRVLYIDLDTVITGNIDNILKSKSRLTMLRDFYQPDVWETGMIYFTPGDLDIYDIFTPDNPPKKSVKDADIISNYLRGHNLVPDFFQDKFKIGSYKISLVRDDKDWRDYDIICFHGNPRPHEVEWDLDNRVQRRGANVGGLKRKGPGGSSPRKKRPVSVEPIWEGEDVFIIGGGPSLTNIDLDKFLSDKNVLGINDAYLYDCTDICFFGDTLWHKYHKEAIEKYDKPVYSTSGVNDDNVLYLESLSKGLTRMKTKVGWNHCSGWAGLNLALNLGAKRIFLLGFDMNFGKDGEPNWHSNIRKVNKNSYKVFLKNQDKIIEDFNKMFSDREVYNVEMPTTESAIQIFPKIKFHELFEIRTEDLYKVDEGSLTKR